MNEAIVVKEYTSDYQSAIVDLILHIQQVEYGVPITKQDQPDLFNVETFYQQGAGNFWVALAGEKVVGTIALIDIGHNQAALRKMFVDKDYRGSTFRTANKLLTRAITWAKSKGVQDIFLGTTLQFVAAHRFYEKNGFQEISMADLPANFPVLEVDTKFYKYHVND